MTVTDRLMQAVEDFIDAKIEEKTRTNNGNDGDGCAEHLRLDALRLELRKAFRAFRAAGV